jgi:hypothetical protein
MIRWRATADRHEHRWSTRWHRCSRASYVPRRTHPSSRRMLRRRSSNRQESQARSSWCSLSAANVRIGWNAHRIVGNGPKCPPASAGPATRSMAHRVFSTHAPVLATPWATRRSRAPRCRSGASLPASAVFPGAVDGCIAPMIRKPIRASPTSPRSATAHRAAGSPGTRSCRGNEPDESFRSLTRRPRACASATKRNSATTGC